MKRNSQRGSTIVELLVATMVMALVVTAIASGMTYSIKNQSEARYREIATTLGQEALDIFRKERGLLGFGTFEANLSNNQNYCVPEDAFSLSDIPPATNCPMNIDASGQDFSREAFVTFLPSGAVRVEVTVSWFKSATENRSVELVQEFTQWN